MEKFQKRFVDEANEYFESLESALLYLENDFSDTQRIDEVFRIMHSLKGSGAMFGFDLLSEVTHDLESLYEQVRSLKIQLNAKIISFTLGAVDQLKKLLVPSAGDEERQLAVELKRDVASLLESPSSSTSSLSTKNAKVENDEQETENARSFFVFFQPNESILENGTNPLYLIDELATLGESKIEVSFDSLPDFKEFDPQKCFASWKVVLYTQEDLDTIQDVFLFVQDDSRIEIIELQHGNVLENQEKLARCFFMPVDEIESLIGEDIDQKENLVPIENEIMVSESVKERAMEEPAPKANEEKRNQLVSGVRLDTIRVSSAKIDEYMNLVSELITAQSHLDLIAETQKDFEPISEHFAKLIRQLRDNAFNMSLIPLTNMATRFRRLVRDLSADLNKKVNLVTEGLETEVDKTIIEQLGEPLLHIIRNSIDHGIEPIEQRLENGKEEEGTILIKASVVGTFVEIEIADDGAGIDLSRIKEKAIKKGFFNEGDSISDSELISVIFKPGFSTSEILSDISGRGVGMDIVRKRIADLRGDVEVDTMIGEGTKFTIRLPLSISIIDGLLTQVNDDLYIIPTGNIEKIYALNTDQKKNALRQVVVFEDQEIPYLDLPMEFSAAPKEQKQQYMVVVRYNNKLFGLVVNDVFREHQAVVKPLDQMIGHHELFLGASIMGDGRVTLVIDINKTIQKFSA